MAADGRRLAISAPTMEPRAVVTSSVIPSLMLARPRSTFTAATALEVATIATSEAATAWWIGTFRASTRKGTIKIPPPMPMADPIRPMKTPKETSTAKLKAVSSGIYLFSCSTLRRKRFASASPISKAFSHFTPSNSSSPSPRSVGGFIM